jgi:hypothetical protein
MSTRVLFRVTAAAVALTMGGAAKADFIIDDFGQPTFTGLVGLTGNGAQSGGRTDSYSTTVGNVTRVLTVNQTQNVLGDGATQFGIGSIGTGGIFTLATANGTSQATATTANVTLSYTYTTAQNLSAGGTFIQFTFTGADLNTPYSVTIGDDDDTSTVGGVATNGAGVYTIDLSAFSGVDLTDVSSILLSLNADLSGSNSPVASADFTLSDVRVLAPDAPPPPPPGPGPGPGPVIPAPPAAVLVLAALPLLGLARARRILPA